MLPNNPWLFRAFPAIPPSPCNVVCHAMLGLRFVKHSRQAAATATDSRPMPDQQPLIGKRFSHLYIERGPPARDSERFRRRLGAYFEQHFWEQRPEIVLALQAELGVEVPAGASELSVSEFFKRDSMSDVLDAVTIISDCLATPQNRSARRRSLSRRREVRAQSGGGASVSGGAALRRRAGRI